MDRMPVTLPLVVDMPVGYIDDPVISGASTPSTLTLQLHAQSGEIYMLPLSVSVAVKLITAFQSWPELKEALATGAVPHAPRPM